MDYISELFLVIASGFKNEISNEFEINDNNIIVKFPDNSMTSISLKTHAKNQFLKSAKHLSGD